MRLLTLSALLLFQPFLTVAASAAERAGACAGAAADAEHKWTLPPHLVAAIGRVESGRPDQDRKRIAPWPWTVNANGAGSYFATRDEAVRFVRALQAQGVRRIDVGCFQVDLFYHPQAFASLEDAFDPERNADYAGRFLTELHAQTGDWAAAVGRYHSALPLAGASYKARVLAEWRNGPALFGSGSKLSVEAIPERTAVSDRFVVIMSATARAVHIFRPSEYD